VILVGAMTPLSAAMAETGAAQLLADKLVGVVGEAGPYALLAGLFILTAVLGQLISNTATALIIIPIAVAAALELGISPRPVMMSVCVAAAASVPDAGGHAGQSDDHGTGRLTSSATTGRSASSAWRGSSHGGLLRADDLALLMGTAGQAPAAPHLYAAPQYCYPDMPYRMSATAGRNAPAFSTTGTLTMSNTDTTRRNFFVASAAALAATASAPALAQGRPDATVEFSLWRAGFIVGGSGGSGTMVFKDTAIT